MAGYAWFSKQGGSNGAEVWKGTGQLEGGLRNGWKSHQNGDLLHLDDVRGITVAGQGAVRAVSFPYENKFLLIVFYSGAR